MANEIATRDEAQVALPEDVLVEGLDTLAPEDFIVPYIRLTQAISDDVVAGDAKPGELRHSLTGELFEQPLEFVPVHVSRNRARFVERSRVCFSPDGKTGIGDPGGDCAKCPFAKWGRERGAQNPQEPPECDLGIQYVCLLPGSADGLPIALILARTSMKTARKLNYFLRAGKPVTYKLTTRAEKNAKGTYFVFDVAMGRPLTPEELKSVMEIRRMLAGRTIVVEQDASDFSFDAGSNETVNAAEEGDPF